MTMTFAPAGPDDLPLYAIEPRGLDAALAVLPPAQAGWARQTGFAAKPGEVCLLPNADGQIVAALAGLGDAKARARQRFGFAAVRAKLPAQGFALVGTDALSADLLEEIALGWLFAGYRFDRYKPSDKPLATLACPPGIDATRLEAIAAGEALTRDLVNIPANDMGPDELEAACRQLAGDFGAEVVVTAGNALIGANFPMIHAVGRAADRAPRLIEMRWGSEGPLLALVGKGVCFDTGGLNLKPGTSMGLMKKDMGGAATVLGLAQMIMALGLPLRLMVLIPAVENAVSGASFRPGDILTSRKGLTVEINNTDAEGRLVLADALTRADEAAPDLILSMATLTGAARVAVGPDLAPFYASANADAAELVAAGGKVRDPLWQLPFWEPYETMIEPGIADLDNAPTGGFAGSITAALFLRRFVGDGARYLHFDIYGWNPKDAPGRSKGGTGQGARAILAALPGLLPAK